MARSSSGGLAAVAVAFALAATGAAAEGGKPGGKLVVIATDDVDYIDPGQGYSSFARMVAAATQKPLYSFEPDNSEDPIADLADAPPEITDDGTTVTVRIKPGVRFSPPVDREVTSHDVKYAIERGFFKTVANGYAGAYFGDIVGAKTGAKAGTEIDGIETPDDQTIVFRLSQPTGHVVASALGLPLSAPVPEEYASRFDRKHPSTYGTHQVATGPYMVRSDAAGRAVGYEPGRLIQLVRNPNWDSSLDYKPAYLDEIEISEGHDDLALATREILAGESMASGDFAPPAAVLQEAVSTQRDQVAFVSAGGSRYVALNTQLEPFDDPTIRKAVVAGFDRAALRLARGGELVGDIPTHIIPPGVPGFEEAGGLEGPGLDFLSEPAGDPTLSAEYFKKAGFASGKYEGERPIVMVGAVGGADQAVAEAAEENLKVLGFKVRLRLVSRDAMYRRYCAVPRAKVHICPNAGWIKDFADGQAVLGPRFNGGNILEENNSNWSQLDVPEINAAMDRAAHLSADRAGAWGAIDTMVSEQAPVIPYLWDKQPVLWSSDVAAVVDESTSHLSLTFSSLGLESSPDP